MLAIAAFLIATADQPLIDKTLVAWVRPSTLDQHGGSVLTIEDGHDHFDGIVFAELGPKKWMAGSDFWRRSLIKQDDVPLETTVNQFVQIAITYAGREVTVYRNGLVIERHQMSEPPQAYGESSRVTIGLRHRRATDHQHFAGEIDDARIYAKALTIDELRALAPNKVTGLKPWAWFTFEDGRGKDLTARFKHIDISGGATIKNGRLVLDGMSGEFSANDGIVPKPETPTRPNPVPTNWYTFHLAHPGPGEAFPGDPNCAFYWKGEYHLHYIYVGGDGTSFAHVSSKDMVHWHWHPTTLSNTTVGHGMFSGTGFFTKEGKPAIIYHGEGSGRNQIQIAESDNLEKWSKPTAIIPIIKPGQDASLIANWDPDAWIDNGVYYALSGGTPGSGKPPTLFRSTNLKDWDYLGRFLTHDMPDVQPTEDVSCPNFFRIGNKWMLLCISHTLGCRYYLGEWKNEKFDPEFHARMNWHGWDCFAPESVLTPDGRRVMWAWCRLDGANQTGIQCLPRELSLPSDGVLRIKPLRELESLRTEPHVQRNISLAGVQLLEGHIGDARELQIMFGPSAPNEFGLDVHCDSKGQSGLPIRVNRLAKTLRIGTVTAPFELKPGEETTLRVFIDKNMVEVFANDRQAIVAAHPYSKNALGVQLVSEGPAMVTEAKSWRLKSIYTR